MNRRTNLLLTLAVMLVLGSMFYVKTNVREMGNERLALLEKQRTLQENIRVLQAEYAFLTNPQRLGVQAKAMGLEPLKNTQVLPYVIAMRGSYE